MDSLKVITIMNFARQCEPRDEENDRVLFDTTKKQLEYLTSEKVENTFLLQYDSLCDKRFTDLFRNEATERTEIGLWYEIVEPLTSAVGMEYRSELGWKWDWHIIPGFSMAYLPKEREVLIDEAMRKFKEEFGYYPRTVGSWLLDTHTVKYLSEHYEIDTFCICRDQTSTDAYTLVGGYFNQAFYPSKNNIFTPAQTKENMIPVPVFRLLGPDPIHNYDKAKYCSPENKDKECCTLELTWDSGSKKEIVDWYFDTYYKNEDLGFSYSQLGQENSFGLKDLITPMKMQLEEARKYTDVKFMKMSDAGKEFKKRYPDGTPATCVTALNNWEKEDVQSIYYDCKNYVANLFRHKDKIFFRAFYLFDERVPEHYLDSACETFDAVYENLPLVDSVVWANDRMDAGLLLDGNGVAFDAKKTGEGELTVSWAGKKVVLSEDGISVSGCDMQYDTEGAAAVIKAQGEMIEYSYKSSEYGLKAENGKITQNGNIIEIKMDKGETVKLVPLRK